MNNKYKELEKDFPDVITLQLNHRGVDELVKKYCNNDDCINKLLSDINSYFRSLVVSITPMIVNLQFKNNQKLRFLRRGMPGDSIIKPSGRPSKESTLKKAA